MEDNIASEIGRTLRMLRRRIVARQFLARMARGTLFFHGFITAMTGVAWWTGALVPDFSAIPYMLTWPFIAGGIAAGCVTLLRLPALRDVAAAVDRLGGTRDRALAAFDFSTRRDATAIQRLAAMESARWLRERDFRPLFAVRPPEELRWLVVPIVTTGLMWSSALDAIAAREADVLQAAATVRGTLGRLDELAKKLDAERSDEKAKQIAEKLRESAAQLRAETGRAGEAHKKALRELAELEQLVKEMMKPEFATSDEIKALADALAQHELTRDAAKEMREGSLENAASKLNEAAADSAAAQAGETLQRALDHLARKREEVSRQIEKLQQQADGTERAQLLQQLAEALNELQQQNGIARQKAQQGEPMQPGQGRPMTDEDLKKLLGVIERMKEQQQGGGGGAAEPGEGEDEQGVQMLSFAQGEGRGDGGEGPQFPTGNPGGEKDEGTTKDPFGKEAAPAAEAGTQAPERGQLGEGESLSVLVPSAASGDGKAQRRYKELTESAASIAEDVVASENIPLGARHLIRRYFEAIRPK